VCPGVGHASASDTNTDTIPMITLNYVIFSNHCPCHVWFPCMFFIDSTSFVQPKDGLKITKFETDYDTTPTHVNYAIFSNYYWDVDVLVSVLCMCRAWITTFIFQLSPGQIAIL
jgi:hypothetical protein